MSFSYTGLWKRASIQIGESEPSENMTVFWLQTGTYFADIRIPNALPYLLPGRSLSTLSPSELLPFAECDGFAGTIDATDRWIRWNRVIDFRPDGDRVDQGDVYFEANNLIEIGDCEVDGQPQKYREVWVPQPLSTDDYWALELVQIINPALPSSTLPRAVWVGVGEHFIQIYDDRAYPTGYTIAAPETLSAEELYQLMRFQVSYGKRISVEKPWQILLSNDPSRVGQSLLEREQYQIKQQGETVIESWRTLSGELIEYHWAIRERQGVELPFYT